MVAEGYVNKEIASTLHLSIKTVEKHRQQMMDKLGIHNVASLTRYAIANGFVECSEAMGGVGEILEGMRPGSAPLALAR
jgi:hypothetical protein